MKQIIYLSMLFLTLFSVGCSCHDRTVVYQPQPNYQQPVQTVVQDSYVDDYPVYYSPSGAKMAMYNYNGTQMLMDYVLFTSLMNRGGMSTVNNYYVSHRSSNKIMTYNSNTMRNYRKSNETFRSKTANTGSVFVKAPSSNNASTLNSKTANTSSGYVKSPSIPSRPNIRTAPSIPSRPNIRTAPSIPSRPIIRTAPSTPSRPSVSSRPSSSRH
jgi:hypothetical protein